MKFTRVSVALALLGAILAVPAIAQTNRGAISGTVTDAQGGAVAGATVIVKNSGTNQTFKLSTTDSGGYTANSLEPVVYSVTAESPGFKKAVVDQVKVDTATTTTIDIKLQVGETRDAVTVTAEAPLVNASESAAGTTVTQAQIEDLPLGDRSVLNLAITLPNVSGINQSDMAGVFQNSIAPGVGLNLNGSRPGEGAFLADGVNNTGVGMSRAVVTFSPDTVQEFKVQTSNFSAEYGNTGGGIINVTTKSGANRIFGSVSWFFRNPATSAVPFTDSSVRPPPKLHRNDGVVTFGGPVYIPKIYNGHNKTFFFVAFEPRWISDGLGQSSIVPTDAWRSGNLSDLVSASGTLIPKSAADQLGLASTPVVICQQFGLVGKQLAKLDNPAAGQTYLPFPGNIIPASMLDPTSQRILKEGMPPSNTGWFMDGGAPRNLTYTRGVQTANKPLTFRVDHNLTDRNKLSGRFTSTPNYGERSRGYFPGSNVNQFQTDYSSSTQILIGDTHIFTPTVVNDLKLNYLRGNYNTTNSPEWQTKNWSTELGLPSFTEGGLPQFNFSTGGMFTIGQNSIGNIGQRIEDSFNIADVLTWNKGNMSLKFGTDLRQARMKNLNQGSAAGGGYRFQSSLTNSAPSGGSGGYDYATFLLGVPNSVDLRTSVLPYYYKWQSSNFFVQDDWKIKPNLTLSVGMRYSLDFPRTEKYGMQAVLRTDLAQTVAMPTQLLNTNGTPYTKLPANLLPATTLVPALTFAGRGGNSNYMYPPDYSKFQPRFGFAWSPKFFGLNSGGKSVVVRGGYGLSYGALTGTDISPAPNFSVTGQAFGTQTGQVDPAYVMRLSSNPPNAVAQNPTLGIPANGILTMDSIAFQNSTFAVAQDLKIPYSQTWSLAIQTEILPSTVLEVGYSGNKGTHLFFPQLNRNAVPSDTTEALSGLNLAVTDTIQDPLKRRSDPSNPNSAILNVPLASVLAPYAGFTSLWERYQSGADSSHHAGYVTLERRMRKGLQFRSTYTFQKTLTNASEVGGVCSPCGAGSRIWTQVSFGASHRQERSVATFNIPHVWATTATYDLPFGRHQWIWKNAPRVVNGFIGNWKLSGIGIIQSGTPFVEALFDTNTLSSLTQGNGNAVVRPDIVPGVPLKNPLYDPSCAYGAACQPYANPSAFQRPLKGNLGNAPSTLPGIYTPSARSLDLSVMKNFRFGESGRFSIQFKADAINVLNYRGYRLNAGNSFNGAWLVKYPTESDISLTEFNTWANAWNSGHPGDQVPVQVSGQPNNAVYQQIIDITRLPKAGNNGVLPKDFYSVPLASGIAKADPNSYDLRNPTGFKMYRFTSGGNYNTSWGTLSDPGNARFLQFSIKFMF